jgi:hypothetical protein
MYKVHDLKDAQVHKLGLVAAIFKIELSIKREQYMVLGVGWSTNSTFCIFAHSFLKEVSFSLEGNHILHPWKGVGGIVDNRLFQLMQEVISTESNVLAQP